MVDSFGCILISMEYSYSQTIFFFWLLGRGAKRPFQITSDILASPYVTSSSSSSSHIKSIPFLTGWCPLPLLLFAWRIWQHRQDLFLCIVMQPKCIIGFMSCKRTPKKKYTASQESAIGGQPIGPSPLDSHPIGPIMPTFLICSFLIKFLDLAK